MSWGGAIKGIGWACAAVVVCLVAALVAIWAWLSLSRPVTRGVVATPGLSQPVTIERDARGIPYIQAADTPDAVYALGFAQAQDRLLQMDLLRRYGEGQVSEIAGKSTLTLDRFMRILGLERLAQQQWATLDPQTREVLDAYAAGVNAYIARRSAGQKPYYLAIPGPAPWRPVDSLVVEDVFAFSLSENYRRELERAQVVERVDAAMLRELYPQYRPSPDAPLPQLAALYRQLPLAELAHVLPRGKLQAEASNNWVVGPQRSATGAPILENDPHVTLSAPGTWWLASVAAPGLRLAGAFGAGLPFLMIGHNARVGWGVTETGGDVEDLRIEQTDPHDPGRYLTPAGWRRFGTRIEVIHVRGGPDVRLVVRISVHGPVISDAVRPPAGQRYAVALAATFLQPGDRTPQALWGIDTATDWRSFHAALADYAAPQMNFVFADTAGEIGFLTPGRVPIRRAGDGWLPSPGWTGAGDWTGFIPFDDLPQTTNPASGLLATANNDITPPGYRYFLGRDWAPPYRLQRIEQRLSADLHATPATSAAISLDTVSLAARALTPLLLRAHPTDARARSAEAMLARWDGDLRADQAAPLIYEAWVRMLERDLYRPRLGAAFTDYWSQRPLALQAALASRLGCLTACRPIVSRALDEALADLRRRYGADPRHWRWGQAHPAVFANLLVGRTPVLGSLVSPSVPDGGGDFTIATGKPDFSDETHPFRANVGPSLRMVLDFTDLDRSLFLMSPGQSEDIVSAHYADLVDSWRRHAWFRLTPAAPIERLRLQPAAARRRRG